MLKIKIHTKFKKDIRIIRKRGYDTKLLDDVILMLCKQEELPTKYRDHKLQGKWSGYRDCHILPDWLLIYRVIESEQVLELSRTGSHSDLF